MEGILIAGAVFIGVGIVLGALHLARLLVVFGSGVPAEFSRPDISTSLIDGERITSAKMWEREEALVRETFEENVYGAFPNIKAAWRKDVRLLDEEAYGGRGVAEEIIFSDATGVLRVPAVLVTPKNARTPSPLVIASNFCANHSVFPQYDVEKPPIYPTRCDDRSPNSPWARLKRAFFGVYKKSLPATELLDRGIAFASFYTGSIVPDDAEAAAGALKALSALSERPVTGVIAAWAWGYAELLHELGKDPRIDAKRIALYGHSRDGKAALLAGAFDKTVSAVIAHQSGKGGASLTRRHSGESIASITRAYPHWFDKRFHLYGKNRRALPIDQHFLLALMAPRPLLLTGAQLDGWADPKGAFLAVRDAAYIYKLYGKEAFSAKKLDDFSPADTLAFFMRPLNHSVRASDWNAIIAFLTAHFAT